ncbi:imelysin family protein [Salaquimonas pukyongi]|uniref:imelysin family protein n=1 Tax=Salaquimonas pukyongi TaxID=2712698 RepID=UPI00096B866B|nr:imelysin family protein [Salaquimonas pukyongi]
MKKTALKLLAGTALAAGLAMPVYAEVTPQAVIDHYAAIAQAKYSDSLAAAKQLDRAIEAFLAKPSQETLKGAKQAWLASRIPYQQTEVYRFGNAIVDDWEGRVNAWPLDEGLIDYVDGGYYGSESDENALFTANVIANAELMINGESVDASKITPDLISGTLHEAGGIEANVASGYHAIEFLLWGQDLNGTDAGAGNRPWTDFSTEDCTNGNCDRRREYLAAASDLLVADLEEMAANWAEGGAARAELSAKGISGGLATILTGMGSLSYGELAGERMKLGLLLGDPEEEHDCFSDNTHNSHLYDTVGIMNVYMGTYVRPDGSTVSGPSIAELVAAKDAAVDQELKADLEATLQAMKAMAQRAQSTEAYDQMIASGNTEGNAVVQAAIDGLIKQTKSIERAITALELGAIELEGSDSLDNPNAVFQ